MLWNMRQHLQQAQPMLGESCRVGGIMDTDLLPLTYHLQARESPAQSWGTSQVSECHYTMVHIPLKSYSTKLETHSNLREQSREYIQTYCSCMHARVATSCHSTSVSFLETPNMVAALVAFPSTPTQKTTKKVSPPQTKKHANKKGGRPPPQKKRGGGPSPSPPPKKKEDRPMFCSWRPVPWRQS